MKDIMLMEKIEHEEARKAVKGTDYDFLELLDFESLRELKRDLKKADEQQCRDAFKKYFEDLICELNYENMKKELKEYELVIHYKNGNVLNYYEENEGGHWLTDAEDGALEMQEIDEELFRRILFDDDVDYYEIVEIKKVD